MMRLKRMLKIAQKKYHFIIQKHNARIIYNMLKNNLTNIQNSDNI